MVFKPVMLSKELEEEAKDMASHEIVLLCFIDRLAQECSGSSMLRVGFCV